MWRSQPIPRRQLAHLHVSCWVIRHRPDLDAHLCGRESDLHPAAPAEKIEPNAFPVWREHPRRLRGWRDFSAAAVMPLRASSNGLESPRLGAGPAVVYGVAIVTAARQP